VAAQRRAQPDRLRALVGGGDGGLERDFYEGNLSTNELNRRWWQYVEQYQGIAPPEPRGEQFCDPATKTHINDDPAVYYQYAIAYAIKYQLHRHIATRLLHQDPRNCNFYGTRRSARSCIIS